MRIHTGNVLELSPARTGRSPKAERTLVDVHRAHADPVAIDTLAEHDPHSLACFLLAELLNTFGDLSWGIDVEKSLVPGTRIKGLVQVSPLTETGDSRGVDFFVELCAAIVLDTFFDSGNDENEEDRKSSGRCRGGSKDGKHCDTLGREWLIETHSRWNMTRARK